MLKKSTNYFFSFPSAKIYSKRNYFRSKVNLYGYMCTFIGVFVGFTLATWIRSKMLNCSFSYGNCCVSDEYVNSLQSVKSSLNLNNIVFKNIDPAKSLVFIGVMTAQKYLDTRAKSVYETWGRNIPGKMSFFSRSGSSSAYDIPLVSLPGVDDSYPPQKKSFMMLKFMHDNYLDKFEWFMRVDDDVYIKPDKLELFLRSLNSSKPQFIGQAGMGNKDEFGLLSLDYDENFCMGGPGIIMSRETLRLVVPHISYCLKNLYSTHEDVEIGRCIRRFSDTPCTWSYEVFVSNS
jgi:chondroitin sulfate synthase